MNPPPTQRPHATVILAMSADGKISNIARSLGKFASSNDYAHLEEQVAAADAVIGGAGTLRSGGTAMRVTSDRLLQMRQQQGKPPQPIQIIGSRSGDIDPNLPFFHQPIPRWLITTREGAIVWRNKPAFDRLLTPQTPDGDIDWHAAFENLAKSGIERLAVLGGGSFVASLLAANLINEFWLTVCPIIFGGATAPTPVDGEGFMPQLPHSLELLEVRQVEQEVFLHYQVRR